MTLKEYIKSLPKERVQLAATDLNEAAKIEQEHAAIPGAVFDTPEQAEGTADAEQQQPAAPTQSFDLTNDDDVKGFIKGMELSHPELVNRLRRDERAWDDMLALDSNYTGRLQRDGQIKFTGDEKADYDFFRWAYGRGMLQSDTSIGGLASAFGRGLWQMAKGAAKLGATAAKSAVNPAAAVELGATTVDAAQTAVAEYQQLGAGLAALTSGDNPQVKMAAMYELAKFADTEQKNHNAWRKAINDSFAEVPVDEDSVEFLSEAFDISNLIGAGAGKAVTTGLKRAGATGAAELLGKSRKALGSEMLAQGLSKVPVIGTPYKRAILVGQADLLSEEAQIAYKSVAEAQADLAAKRATLAAAPAADPKDVLLKQVAEAEADVARKQAAFDVANTKLNTVRQGVSDALDLEGRGLLDRAAASTVEGTGMAVRGAGRTMTRAYRGLSELLTGEADNAAFDMAAGQMAGNLASKGNVITRVGQDMVAAGRTMAQNGATIPYFRRLRQAEDATKLTRGAAAFIDWSHLGWAADKVGDTLKAGAAGAPVSGAFGYVASGGDLAAAAESAGAGAAYGIGGGAYGQWQAYTDPRFRYEELLANRRQFRDTLSARDVGGASQLQIFDQLDAGDQLAVATYAQGKPDVAFRFINDRNQASGYYDRDNNVVVINRASKTPIADIFRHEVAHFVERHGLQAQVREMYLGDAEKGVIGQYTALDKLGNPVFVESTDPDGTTRYGYKLNEAGEKLKAEYESKIRAVDPTFKMSDEYLASELFAEQYADSLMGGGFRRDLSRNAVDNIVDALAAKPVLKNFLGGIGLLFDQNENVVGTGVFKELKANEGVRRLMSGFTAEVSKGKKPVIEDAADQHVFSETELRNPELATKWLQGGGAMRFGPDGKPVYDSKGVPQFLTEKEADAMQRDLANELITEIEKHAASNPEDADLLQRREIVDVNGVKRTVFTGRRIPAAVIDALEAQKRFNPHQLAHLRAASASVEKHGTGAMIAHFYQAASRKLGGKAYKTVGGRWRRDGVVGFQITKDGNVVLNSVSWEQLAENATKAAKTKLAREVYATAGMPVDTAIVADVKTYLGNLVDGKPGATDIGEARRDFINNLLGIRMAANAEANPLFETTTAPKTILTNLRLDRINRMAPLDYVDVAWGPQQYRQAKANMRPEDAPMGPEDSQLEGFNASLREKMSERIKNAPRSDYAEGDTLYTPKGTPVKFISDLLPNRRGKDEGAQRAYVRLPDGSESSFLLSDLSPEPPAGKAPKAPRDLGSNVEFAVPPSDADAVAALASDKQPKFGLARDLEPGTPVGLRIDIPAFQRTGKYVVSVHEKAKGSTVGRIVGYDTVVTVDNPTFMSNEAGAAKILTGDKNKFPIATVEGSFNASREIPADINNWTAVGFDPLDHSYFYDKRTDEPVVGGSQAVSVGNSVFVKDPVYGERSDFQYRPDSGQTETPGDETSVPEHPGRLRIGNVPTKKSAEEFIAMHKLTETEADAYREVVNDVRTSDKTALPVEPQYDENGRPTFETDYNDEGEKVTTLKVRQIRYDFLNAPEVSQIRDRLDKKYQSRLDDLAAKRDELRTQDEQLVATAQQLETERKAEGTTKARKEEIRAQIAKIKDQRVSLREKSAKLAEKIDEEKSGWRDGRKHEWVDKATDAVASQIVTETRKAELEPTVKAGIGWYSKMRAWLQSRFGAGIESFSQLLGATSARTPVDENFKQSLDALRRISRGDYDGLLNAYHEHVTKTNERVAAGEIDADEARKSVNKYIEEAVAKHDERVTPINDSLDEVKKQLKAGEITQDTADKRIADLEAQLADANSTAPIPLRSNGKKFNANTPKVLQALYGNWLEMVQGPKTPNFSGNLSGRTLKATIDVWAARTLRRLLYENKTYNPETGRISTAENRWRILPEAETGVEHSRKIGREIGGDFGFAQEAFQKAADQMGMNADDLQALLWFHEKHVWDLKGWTKAAGKVKSSFESEAGKLNTERFQLGATTSTSPIDNSYHEARIAQDAFDRELRRTRDSIAETSGMVYARVTPSEGLYGGAMEPSFDAEFVTDRGTDVSPVLQKLINIGREYRQYDVFMSQVVDRDHPNSRPGLEIGFRAAETKEFVDQLTEALRANGIDGFTVARDRRGRPIGIRTQFVPEMTARWVDNWADYLDSDKVRALAVDWGNNARNALKSLSPEIRSKLSYESETFFDTRVFGREEYDKAPNTWAASSLEAELGRRRPVVEEHKRRQ